MVLCLCATKSKSAGFFLHDVTWRDMFDDDNIVPQNWQGRSASRFAFSSSFVWSGAVFLRFFDSRAALRCFSSRPVEAV